MLLNKEGWLLHWLVGLKWQLPTKKASPKRGLFVLHQCVTGYILLLDLQSAEE